MPDAISPTRARTRKAVLDAAALAFREVGFEGTPMEEIARRAGVSRGTLYYNFGSKEEIAIGVAERLRMASHERTARERAGGADALELLRHFFAFAGEGIAANRDAFAVATRASLKGVGRSPQRTGTTELFRQILVQGQEEGTIRSELAAAEFARLLSALLSQAALYPPDGEDAATWPSRLLSLALGGALVRTDGA